MLPFLLLTLFLGYLGSALPFSHTHDIDGHTVTHSHPYTGTPGHPGHSHTTLQFQTIAQLALMFAVLVASVSGLPLLPTGTVVLNTACRCCTDHRDAFHYELRGPPSRI